MLRPRFVEGGNAMFPVRLSLVTYNLWNTERWKERAPALSQFLSLFSPDVLCLQELTGETRAFLDRELPGHERVDDPLPGWTVEGNIFWKSDLFQRLEHGAEEVGHPEPDRRLFWVRLALRDRAKTLFISTAHLTTPTREEESETGVSPRVGQLKRIGACLEKLVKPGEPAFFMGDMNDARHPQRILKKSGYVSCFSALALQSPPTFKCWPTAGVRAGQPASSEAIDLIVANENARAVSACVPQMFCGDVAPSDHWPVQAIYEI
jgi:endonuclease/exonuclease/phosphatase family metal-dependent hydrolase